ncbi:MAG: polysaccharide biosynthesis tyrosine autokinase [Muribaculaceae bacterium]|nr:polysaccharide biosynthesis tyrosine autokinase [Muribaculaceae bacterium]
MAAFNNTSQQNVDIINENSSEESFDLIGLLLDYINHWKFFVCSLIICLGCAFFYIRTVIPTFRVTATVVLDDDNTAQSSAFSLTQNNPLFNMKDMFDETELEILKSRNSIMKVIDTLKLAYSYYNVGSLRDEPLYKNNPLVARLDTAQLNELEAPLNLKVEKTGEKGFNVAVRYKSKEQKFDTVAKLGSLPATIETPLGNISLEENPEFVAEEDEPFVTQRIVIANPVEVAKEISKNLDVHFKEKASTIVNFEYVTPLPDLGDDLIRMLIYIYNRQIIDNKNLAAIQTEAFLQDRLRDVQDELKTVEENLKDYRERHNVVSVEAQVNLNLSARDKNEIDISEIISQDNITQQLIDEVNKLQIAASLPIINYIPMIAPSPEINKEIETFNLKVDNYNRQRSDMTQESELIKNYITLLSEQRAQILRSLQALRQTFADKRRSMSHIQNRSTAQLAQQPQVDKGLQEIFRDQSVKDNIYTFLLQKREEIAIQKTMATPSAKFIDDPSVFVQVAPKSLIIYFLGFILGLLIPGVCIYLRRILFPKFKDKDDLSRITNVPIIGELSIGDNTETDVVVGENVSTSIAELFRLLRNNINFARTGGKKQVILLTSAISGEGKTFVALNLAMTYALTKKKVVVIGFDIRRPVLAHKLGLSNRVGVTSYLSDQVDDINQIIHQSKLNPYLYVIPAGPVPPNPNELLLSERMDELFKQLREEFDYIIVDTAPIGLVSDSFLIFRHSDIQLFVTRASYSTPKGIRVLHEAIRNGHIEKGYVVLNGVDNKSRTYKYKNYGAYYSSNGSGYGYGATKRSEGKSKSNKDSKSSED